PNRRETGARGDGVNLSGKTIMLWLRALGQGATLLGLFMIAFIWLSLEFHLTVERSNAERAAIPKPRNPARAFEEHLSRSIKDIDRVLLLLRAGYEHDPSGFAFEKFLYAMPMAGEATLQFARVDAAGLIKERSVGPPPPAISVADREHFIFQRDPETADLCI